MNVLAVDTATRGMSVSVFSGGGCVVTHTGDNMRDQAALLLPLIKTALQDAGLGFHDLDLLAAATGPGSFTGIRVGLAAMQGIALSADLPLAGFSNFEIYRRQYGAEDGNAVLVVLESHRKEAFCRLYPADGGAPEEPFQTDAAGVLQRYAGGKKPAVIGNAVAVLEELSEHGFFVPRIPESFASEKSAQYLGRLALDAFAAAEENLPELCAGRPAVPFYIRPPDVNIPPTKKDAP